MGKFAATKNEKNRAEIFEKGFTTEHLPPLPDPVQPPQEDAPEPSVSAELVTLLM